MNEELFTALPRQGDAAIVGAYYRKRLIKSLMSMLRTVERALRADLNFVKRKFENLNVNRKFGPHIYYLHYQLQRHVKTSDAAGVKGIVTLLENLPETHIYAPVLQISSGLAEEWELFIQQDVQDLTATNSAGKRGVMLGATSPRLEEMKSYLHDAIKTIASYDPEMKSQLDEYVTHIKIFDGDGIIGMTDVRVFGAVFIRTTPPAQNPLAYFTEHLIHETSHLHLNALMAYDPIIANPPEELYPAPIRLDPRPMYGVFHATYVLSRIVRFFRLLRYLFPENKNFEKTLKVTESQFQKGMGVVSSFARPTLLGRKIIDSLKPTTESLIPA